jgi:hypothetical protein
MTLLEAWIDETEHPCQVLESPAPSAGAGSTSNYSAPMLGERLQLTEGSVYISPKIGKAIAHGFYPARHWTPFDQPFALHPAQALRQDLLRNRSDATFQFAKREAFGIAQEPNDMSRPPPPKEPQDPVGLAPGCHIDRVHIALRSVLGMPARPPAASYREVTTCISKNNRSGCSGYLHFWTFANVSVSPYPQQRVTKHSHTAHVHRLSGWRRRIATLESIAVGAPSRLPLGEVYESLQ